MSAVEWDFESFPVFLAAREGRLAVNMACYIGHSNVRRWVMGDAGSQRPAGQYQSGFPKARRIPSAASLFRRDRGPVL